MAIRRVKSKSRGTRYSVRVHLGGGSYKMLGTYATLEKAREVEAEWILEREPTERKTGNEWADFFLEGYEAKNKRSSYDTAKTEIGQWRKTFGNRSLASITELEADEWARENQWAVPAVITMLNVAVKRKVLKSNPFAGLSHKGPGRKENEPLTVADIEKLAAGAKKHWGATMEAFVVFTAYSGMRVGEVFALKWDDIDFHRSRIVVKRRFYRGELDKPKSNRSREIALLGQARDALLGLDRKTEWVFEGVKGGPLTQGKLSNYWQKIEASFDRPVQPHELKHFCGHFLYVTMGLADRVVAQQLGHNDGGKLVRELYGHGDVGALDEIDRAFAKEPAKILPFPKAQEAGGSE